jgi:hypothetical protein
MRPRSKPLEAQRGRAESVGSLELFQPSLRLDRVASIGRYSAIALAGRTDNLRERAIGAEMFGRQIDYDTANDAASAPGFQGASARFVQ